MACDVEYLKYSLHSSACLVVQRYMETKMRIHLHIGVHKTATTLVQEVLADHRDKLLVNKIGFLPMQSFREQYTRELRVASENDASIDELIQRCFDGHVSDAPEGIIISDENLIGYCGTIVKYGRPFLDGPRRLSLLRRMLKDHDVTLFVSIREYSAFLASAYCEGLRNDGRFVPFSDMKAMIDPDDFSWPRILESFVENIQPSRVCVWRFESFIKQPRMIMNEIAFNKEAIFDDEDFNRVSRPSFSQAAVDALNVVRRELGADVANKLLKPVVKNLPKSDEFPAFSPWTVDEQKAWGDKYLDDCIKIPARYWILPEDKTAGSVGEGNS